MVDGSEKPIEQIVPGDKVLGLKGPARVTRCHHTRLGSGRTMMRLDSEAHEMPLRLSDDHDLWVRIGSRQGWGTFNHAHWQLEAIAEGSLDVPAVDLRPLGQATVACPTGWITVRPWFEPQPDGDEVIWSLSVEDGGSFMANGLVVIASHCRPSDIEGVAWNGLFSLPGCFAQGPTTCRPL